MKNIRVRLHLAHYAPTAIYSLRTTHGPLYFRDNFGDITNVVNLFYRQVYSPPGKLLNGPILDIGANIGLAAAWFSSCVPGSAIYCFEPVAANAELIPLNCPSAQVVCAAVGRQHGTRRRDDTNRCRTTAQLAPRAPRHHATSSPYRLA